MKTAVLKTITVGLALALVFNTQSVLAGNVKPRDKKATETKSGGGDTGGGNTKPYAFTPLDEDELRYAINTSTTFLKNQLYAEETQFNIVGKTWYEGMAKKGSKEYIALVRFYKKFFSNKEFTVYDKLKTISYRIQDAACMDEGEPNDASYENGVICISKGRLKSKLSKENAHPQLRGLLFHELAHAMGESHSKPKVANDEFDLFRDNVANVRSSDFMIKFIDNIRDFRYVSYEMVSDYKVIVSYLNEKDALRSCMNLAVLERVLRKYSEDVVAHGARNGAWIMSRAGFVNLSFAHYQTIWAMNDFCNGGDHSLIGQRYTPIQSSQPSFLTDYYGDLIKDRTILHAGYNESASMLVAMKEVGTVLEQLKSKLDQMEELIQKAYR